MEYLLLTVIIRIVGLLAMVHVIIYMLYLFKRENEIEPISFILFKLPRSGSSWITDILNSYPHVYISKGLLTLILISLLLANIILLEIIQASDSKSGIQQKIMENHIMSALRQPMDKLSSIMMWLPTTRFIVDFYMRGKALKALKIIGSININKIIEDSQRNVRVVALIRSNMMKVAVSDYLGRHYKLHCGQSNLLKSDHREHCQVNSNHSAVTIVPWNESEYFSQVIRWQERYLHFFRYLETINQREVIRVYYEDFQLDLQPTLSRLFSSINSPTFTTTSAASSVIDTKSILSSLNTSSTSLDSNWAKRASEDLRDMLPPATFDRLLHRTLSHASCDCWRDQLLATKIAKPLRFCTVRPTCEGRCVPWNQSNLCSCSGSGVGIECHCDLGCMS